MRHNLLDFRRSEERRRVREEAVARSEAERSAADLVVEAEMLKKVVAAVLDIGEPYRGTLLLRYFEDLPLKEVARRQGVPLETVRTRLKRAISMLRERFDSESHGDRAAWCMALAPLAGRPDASIPSAAGAGASASAATALTLGGILMAKKALALVAVAFVLVGAGWLAFQPGGPVPSPGPAAQVAENDAPAPRPSPRPPQPSGPPAEDAIGGGLPPPVVLLRCDRDLDLFGEVVEVDGKAVPGAQVSTLSYPRRRARVTAGEGFWSPVRTPRTRTASDGTFAVRLRKGELTDLEVSKEGWGTSVLPSCQAGEKVRVVLAKATSLAVVVRGPSGKPVEGAKLRLFGTGPILLLQATTVVREGTTGPEGRFVFEGLPQESLTLVAAHPMYGLATGLREASGAGTSTTLEVTFDDGKSIEGRVTDSETGQPIPGASVGTTLILPLVAITDKEGHFLLGGWTERLGSRIRTEAPGYVATYVTTTALVSDSGPLNIALEKGDRVVGRLVGGDGKSVPEALLGALGERREGQRSESDQRVGACGPDGRFVVESLRRDMPHTLVVLAPGFARTLLDFPPREGGAGTIDLGDIVIPWGNSVEGTVVSGDGEPLAGVLVEVRGANPDRARLLPADSKPRQGSSGTWERRRTDDLGRYRFPDQPAGTLVLTATVQGSPPVTREIQIVQGKPLEPIELRLGVPSKPGLPAGKEHLVVLVASEEGAPVEGASVLADFRASEEGARATTKADGSARLENLPAGDVHVSVQDARSATRFLAVRQTVALPHEGDLRIVVRSASSVSGTVLGPDGKPLPGLLVQVMRAADGSSLGGKMTDEAGKFVLAAHLGEEVDIDVSSWPPGRGDQVKGRLAGVRAPAADLVIHARKAEMNRTLLVVLTDVESGGVEGATVYATLATGGRPTTASTDAAGRARFEGLMDDEYAIMIVGPGPGPTRNRAWDESVPPTARKVVPNGQEEAFRFRKGIAIRGVAKLPDGSTAAGGTAFFSASDGAMNWIPVDFDGRFRAVVPAGVKLLEIGVETQGPGEKKFRGSRKDWTPSESCDIVITLEPCEDR